MVVDAFLILVADINKRYSAIVGHGKEFIRNYLKWLNPYYFAFNDNGFIFI